MGTYNYLCQQYSNGINISMHTMISDKQKQKLIKTGLAGGILATVGTLTYGNGSISLYIMNFPAAVPLFVAGSGASLLTDLVHDQMQWESDVAIKLGNI